MIAPVDNPLIGFLLLTAVSSFDPGLGSGVGVGFVVDGVEWLMELVLELKLNLW